MDDVTPTPSDPAAMQGQIDQLKEQIASIRERMVREGFYEPLASGIHGFTRLRRYTAEQPIEEVFSPKGQTVDPPQADEHASGMSGALDERDARRLEDRIAAVDQAGQLRLEAAMARVEGALALSAAATAGLQRDVARTQTTLLTVILPVIVAVGLGLGGLMVAMGQTWIGGVQVGQTIHASAAAAPATSAPAASTTTPAKP